MEIGGIGGGMTTQPPSSSLGASSSPSIGSTSDSTPGSSVKDSVSLSPKETSASDSIPDFGKSLANLTPPDKPAGPNTKVEWDRIRDVKDREEREKYKDIFDSTVPKNPGPPNVGPNIFWPQDFRIN